MKEHTARWRKGEETLAKWLKKGKDTGGFAIEGKGEGGSIVRVNNTHLQSLLTPRKRRPQGQIEHWFDLKGEEKNENS